LVSSSQQGASAAPVDGPSQSTPTAAANGKSRSKASKPSTKRVDSDEGDDDQPIVPKKRAARKPPKKKTKVQVATANAAEESEMDEDDKPLAPTKKSSTRGKRKVKVESEVDDDAPLVKKPATTPKARGKTIKKDESPDAEVPKPKKKGSKAKKEDDSGVETPKKGKKAKKGDEEDEEIHRWWDNENPAGDGTQKWQTLQHNGVYFPPPYNPLPSHVKMKYDGISFLLSPLIRQLLSVTHRQACQPA